jgi:hypothetical protein
MSLNPLLTWEYYLGKRLAINSGPGKSLACWGLPRAKSGPRISSLASMILRGEGRLWARS